MGSQFKVPWWWRSHIDCGIITIIIIIIVFIDVIIVIIIIIIMVFALIVARFG